MEGVIVVVLAGSVRDKDISTQGPCPRAGEPHTSHVGGG
jgi:hypothetical protein